MEAQAQNAYVLVSVRADFLGRDDCTIEAICSSPDRARELRRAILADGSDIRRAYVNITAMDRLYALPYGEDEVLETSEEDPSRA